MLLWIIKYQINTQSNELLITNIFVERIIIKVILSRIILLD